MRQEGLQVRGDKKSCLRSSVEARHSLRLGSLGLGRLTNGISVNLKIRIMS